MMHNQWFYMMCNQWLRLGVILPHSWGYLGVTLGLFRGYLGVTLGFAWGYLGVIMPNFARFYAFFTHFRLNIKSLYI